MDATIIEAQLCKNKEQQRDPEMHQTKKGNQWHFGMKAHIGVDAKSGLTHSLVTTAANSMTSISWVICFMEGAICLSRCRLPGAPQREGLAEVDVDWLIAERPGGVKREASRARTKRPSTSNT